MTDRELLEMAAKAAGAEFEVSDEDGVYLHQPIGGVAERADSAQWLREFADMEFSYYSREATQLRKAADMLEADVSLINEGNKAQQAKRVPLSDDQIEELAEGIAWDDYAHDLARRVEKHHGITPADKPTDDESEDLYALALKADNWGQP